MKTFHIGQSPGCSRAVQSREESLYSLHRILVVRGGGGRKRVTEIRYNGEQDNYWDHSHNGETLQLQEISSSSQNIQYIHFIYLTYS